MFTDLYRSIRYRFELCFYTTLFDFLSRYRRTVLGPWWIVLSPVIFVFLLSGLYSRFGANEYSVFVPHLTIGFVVWTFMSTILSHSSTVLSKYRSQMLQGGMIISDAVISEIVFSVVYFLHQIIVIVAVLIYFEVPFTFYSLVSLVGLLIIAINGVWLTTMFGIFGVLFRDLGEIVNNVMRVAFLITPIIWMPSSVYEGGVLGAYLKFNPFYHFLHVVRGPLMGTEIPLFTWGFVLVTTVVGFLATMLVYKRFAKRVTLYL